MTNAAEALAATPANAESEVPRHPMRKSALSRPSFPRRVTLRSVQAQRVLNRNYSKVSYSLFALDVILQIIGEKDEVEKVEEIISGYFTAFETDLDAAIAQAEAILADAQITERPEYDQPVETILEIVSPRGAQYTNLLLKLDEFMAILDALWITGNISSRERTDTNYQWQQRLIRLAGSVIGTEKRARIAAYNKGKQEEVDATIPNVETDDPEIEKAAEDQMAAEDEKEQAKAAADEQKQAKETAKA